MNNNGALTNWPSLIDFDDDGGDYEEEDGEKEKDDVFHLIDGIFEGADSSGHVVWDDPVEGTGEQGDDEDDGDNHEDDEGEDDDDEDDEGKDVSVDDKMVILFDSDNGQWHSYHRCKQIGDTYVMSIFFPERSFAFVPSSQTTLKISCF